MKTIQRKTNIAECKCIWTCDWFNCAEG